MATFTTNYNLRKPVAGDFVTVSTDLDANFDAIDTEMKARKDVTDLHETRLVVAETALLAPVDFGAANWTLKRHFVIIKDATESVNNSAAMQDDDHFFFQGTSGYRYVIEMGLFIDNNTTSDFKCQWNFPTAGTGKMSYIGLDTTATAASASAMAAGSAMSFVSALNTGQLPIGAAATTSLALLSCCFILDGTSGLVYFRWAQNTATAVNTNLYNHSYCKVWEYKP